MSTTCLAPLSPGALRALDPSLLAEFLAPYRDYLATKGLPLPHPEDPFTPALDCNRLFAVLSRPGRRAPVALVEGLHHVAALASADHMAALLADNERLRLGLTFPAHATPADVALRFWMTRPDLVERRAAESQIDRAATLTLFAASGPVSGPLPFPNEARLRDFAAQLAPWFEARRRGRTCEVFAVQRPEGLWLVIARGDAVRCTPTRNLEDDRPGVVRYRPERHDLILYRPSTGELGIRAPGLRLIDHYRATFGACFFSDADRFRPRAKYDLTPLALVGRAALACEDFAGQIDWVRLVVITQESQFAPAARITHEADDLFAHFEATRQGLPDAPITCATFRVKFTDARRPRTFSIRSACKVRQARDADAFLLEAWLRARGFVAGDCAAAVAA